MDWNLCSPLQVYLSPQSAFTIFVTYIHTDTYTMVTEVVPPPANGEQLAFTPIYIHTSLRPLLCLWQILPPNSL